MRIIGGTFKGKKLFEAFDKNTRPLKDLVKESIFNILEHSKDQKLNLKNSTILDLFSGTGSFGLECISRGTTKVYFFENYKNSLEILNKNIKKLKCTKNVNIINDSAYNFYKHNNLKNEKFDLIFLDPPFKEQNIYFIIKNIIDLKILQKNGIIILHRHKKTKDDLGKKILIERSIKYGISKIIFCKLVT